MKRAGPALALCMTLGLSALPACFLTDAAGHRPSRSYDGTELRVLIARSVALGWSLGAAQYIDSRQEQLPTGASLKRIEEYGDYPDWFLFASALRYASPPVSTHAYYREKPADDCLARIQIAAGLFTRIYLDSAERERTVSASTGDVTLRFVSDEDFRKAALFAQSGVQACSFETTGRVIEAKNASL